MREADQEKFGMVAPIVVIPRSVSCWVLPLEVFRLPRVHVDVAREALHPVAVEQDHAGYVG
eukprot:CAMPEP_0119522694 /NCGR_PEP_ID=MMETSP1344-20130328/37938_1 /TAXON_ID=236787 /ORGANISM="Florenciella parvula, Strain CCMP2471" /LENGTH=60 /DNA_ID=CAMNT_0007560743 /DNA_START=704 /DNA_END=883 /DNA_ORIENTATION=-